MPSHPIARLGGVRPLASDERVSADSGAPPGGHVPCAAPTRQYDTR